MISGDIPDCSGCYLVMLEAVAVKIRDYALKDDTLLLFMDTLYDIW